MESLVVLTTMYMMLGVSGFFTAAFLFIFHEHGGHGPTGMSRESSPPSSLHLLAQSGQRYCQCRESFDLEAMPSSTSVAQYSI